MQEDTCRGDGLNLYAYCANNPVMYYDPSGRNRVSCNTNTDAEKNAQQENVTCDPDNDISNNPERTIISPEIEKKILEGQRKVRPRNEVIKISSDVTVGYPTGGGGTGFLDRFEPVDPD